MKVVNLLGVFAIILTCISCGRTKSVSGENSLSTTESSIEMSDDMSSTEQESPLSDSYINESFSGESEDSVFDESNENEDWDALLDSYEDYVDSYISLLKKANAGDLSALSEYPNFFQKAQELGEKMSNASSDLSASQLNRYNRINQKMLNAAQEMN